MDILLDGEMPKISESQLLANRAVSRVRSILGKAGALSEVITNDYGEDLLVQTQREGDADPFHIYIQVKGTRLKKGRDGKFYQSLRIEHLYRWISHLYPVLVCIYDDDTENVYVIDPRERFSLWNLSISKYKTVRVKFLDSDRFDKTTAKRWIWQCRIGYFSDLLAIFENRTTYFVDDITPQRVAKAAARETRLIALNFIKSIGIVQGDEISENFRTLVRSGARYFSEQYAEDGSNLREVFMFLVLGEADDVCKTGLPRNLLEHGTEMTGYMFSWYHPQEWSDANSKFHQTWMPFKGIS